MNIIKKVTYLSDEGFVFQFEPIEDSIKIIKTKTGFDVRYLIQDDYVENPFTTWEGNGQFYHWKEHGQEEYNRYCELLGYNPDTREIEKEDNPLAVRIDKYEHSCISYSVEGEGIQCRFDTSHTWAVWFPDEVALEEIKRFKTPKTQRKRAVEMAREACELFNQWANGDVYCLVREVYNKNKEYQEHDTMAGYFGYKEALKALETEI